MQPEPIFDLAHLGHMELLTPKPDESLKFFVDVMGMTISGRKGESVYLRGWDDYERYSLKLTASKTSGMEHMALRARSPQALERRVAALKGSGFDIGWTDGDMGQGPAFRCRDPDGQCHRTLLRDSSMIPISMAAFGSMTVFGYRANFCWISTNSACR